MGFHTNTQERGFKHFWYINLDGVIVCAMVWVARGRGFGSNEKFPFETLIIKDASIRNSV